MCRNVTNVNQATAFCRPIAFCKMGTWQGTRYVLLATEYLLKWIEAEAYAIITKMDTINFVWKNIFCKYGIPTEIVIDNESQFQNVKLKESYD